MYLTWMHWFLVSCYGAIVAMCLVMVTTAKLIRTDVEGDDFDQSKLANCMHYFSVWGIPALVGLAWIVLFVAAGFSDPMSQDETVLRNGRVQVYRPD